MHISWYKTINIVTRLEIRACRETPRLSNRLVSKLCFPNMKYFEVIVTVKRLFLRYYLDKSKLEKNGKIERIKGYLRCHALAITVTVRLIVSDHGAQL